jgi:hypothetical protein
MAAVTTLAALEGCNTVIPEPAVEEAPEAPLFTDPACLPTSLASRSPQHRLTDVPGTPPTGTPMLGAAVDVVQFGPLQAQAPGYGPDLFSEVLVGVPFAPLGHGGSGLVRWVTLNRTTGQFADPNRYPATEILGPSGADEFGHAVIAADVVGPYSTPALNPVLRRAQGQEVIVGAPSASGGGRVYVYQASYAIADVGSVDDRTVWQWQPFTTLNAPAGTGSAFGASLAVDRRLNPGDQAPYFAVGAPGANAVYIYSVDTSTSPPTGMNLVQTITPSGLGAGFTAFDFGFAVVIDDFDRDGFADLAIGAPGDSQAPPRVFIVPGAQSGSVPFDTSIPTALSPVVAELGTQSRFGEALDSGNLFKQQQGGDPDGPRSLVIGAPEAQGRGGVCWAAFGEERGEFDLIEVATPGSGAVECRRSPFPHSGARFGAAVAVGNVSPVDPFLNAASPEALIHEVVVGAPGAPPIAWTSTPPFEPDAGAGATSGLVVILRGDGNGGPIVPPPTGATIEERPLAERYLVPDVSGGGSRFGTALRIFDVQATARPDLIVGAHGFDGWQGAVQVLNSAGANGLIGNAGGVFTGVDANGDAVSITVVDTGQAVLLESAGDFGFTMQRIVDDEPVECQATANFLVWSVSSPVAGSFPIRNRVGHTIGDGPTSFSVAFDTDGDAIDPTDVPTTIGNGGAVLVNLTLTDANFGNSDPADDELTVTFNQIATWCNGDWRDIQQVGACVTAQALVHPDCFIPNNPFTFTRFSGLGETCE